MLVGELTYQGVKDFLVKKQELEKSGGWPVTGVDECSQQLLGGTILGKTGPGLEDDIYDAERENDLWQEYRNRSVRDPSGDNIAFTYDLIANAAGPLVKDAKCFVDFGAMYAGCLDSLAGQAPDCKFVGVDRSAQIKRLNDAEFARENLEFVASDIYDFLASQRLDDGILLHSKTCMFLYPAGVGRLYEMAKSKGVKTLLCVEWAGYSHELDAYYEFSADEPRPSAVMRPPLFTHNYPWLACSAGFRPIDVSLFKCPMRRPWQQDAHLLVMVARAD